MKLLWIVSWRNIWRHPARSSVLLAAIVGGLWAGIVTSGWGNGMINQRIEYVIGTELTHAQIHHPEYRTEREPQMSVPEADEILQWLESNPKIENHSVRTLSDGMARSAVTTSGVRIRGVNPASEIKVTTLHNEIREGEFLPDDVRYPVAIGERLAQKLNLEVHERLVLQFQDIHNDITSASFTIAGIFKTASGDFDEYNVFVKREDLAGLLGDEHLIHEMVMSVYDREDVASVVESINEAFPLISAQTWYQLSPELRYLTDMIGIMLYIIMAVIMLALAFGILNTMLMAIFERTRELGMLLSVGMSRARVFFMILIESVMLSFSGALTGLALGWLTIYWLSDRGIDLSVFGDGLAEFGIDTVIYPALGGFDYFMVTLIVLIAVFGASVYPGIKAIRLNPIEAARE
ncbi:ABC transporter permease [Balneolaceae bacterium ANBcel3]|nr:ABC transporter permease [Balneolaceae bacterium ANBcel3]